MKPHKKRVALFGAPLVVLLLLLLEHFELGSSLNDEGKALLGFRRTIEVDPFSSLANWVDEGDVVNPCSWAGVACREGYVVSLKLNNLSLTGTLSPDICKLVYLKHLNLSNNSFYGIVPKEFGELNNLVELDLGYNSFQGPLPTNLKNLLFSRVLVLEGNRLLHNFYKIQGDDHLLSSSRGSVSRKGGNATTRRLLDFIAEIGQNNNNNQTPSPPLSCIRNRNCNDSTNQIAHAPGPVPSTRPFPPPAPSTRRAPPSAHSTRKVPPSAHSAHPVPFPPQEQSSKKTNTTIIIIVPVAVVSVLILLAVVLFVFYMTKKASVVKPLGPTLSGQLKKAFVEGVQSLKESELRTACEEYSNVINEEQSDCTLFKGILSSGVEIAVNRLKLDRKWSKSSQKQFRKRIETLSKMSHKNFVSLIGYCEEDRKQLARMMVFEYASNGPLFEHLHVKEQKSDHLNWNMRLRVAMGVAYCLKHMHQLDPPIVLGNLESKAIFLTDDFAAKIVDMDLWSQTHEIDPKTTVPVLHPTPDLETIVYKFGLVLLELVTGKSPYSMDIGSLISWASEYLEGDKPLEEMLDPTLGSFSVSTVGPLCQVIQSCLNLDPKKRPTMAEAVELLRKITSISPNAAAPRLSPLWWAEFETVSLSSASSREGMEV